MRQMRRMLKAACLASLVGLVLAASAWARVTLRAAPAHVGRYGIVHFSGRLLGGHIPRRGKPLVLEARQGNGRWKEFSVIRTGAGGHFHASYRFEFLGPGRWQIRVLCEAETGYPFATGWSNVVRVRVRVY